MLSIANVGNGKVAANYYETADDYYVDGTSPSRWWGVGADLLGLKGGVNVDLFAELLDGKLPNGNSLHNAASGRRGGTDMTFSAPKSVSMQALIGSDFRVMQAHEVAVTKALTYAQKYSGCRVTSKGSTQTQLTENLVIARFEHDLSRACDPQLHTHCVAINATQRKDGKWRAMDNQFMYRMKMLLGVMYRAELAKELQVLGYEVRQTHTDGRFELTHINDDQVRSFSKRSKAIETWLTNRGGSRDKVGAWSKKLIAVITRERKTDVDRNYLKDEWQKTCVENNIDFQPRLNLIHAYKADLNAIFDNAIEHLSERESVFTHHQLLQAALERSIGTATLVDIESHINQLEKAGTLIKFDGFYTTKEAQEIERNILRQELESRATLEPVLLSSVQELKVDMKALAEGQKSAVTSILKTQNQFIGIQGRAGAGKTTLLKVAAEKAIQAGYKIKGLAPSAAAARELSDAGFKADTIASFVNSKANGLDEKTILFVDEAGMVSTKGMQSIVDAASKSGSRVVFIGDTEQLKAVEAGKPFAQLQNNGMPTVQVNQIQRQKNKTLKHAVELCVEGRVALAVDVLDKKISQVRDANTRFDQIANDYVQLTEEERVQTRVVSGTRYARSKINEAIRIKLGLFKTGIDVKFLARKDMTQSQSRSTLSYQAGDVLIAEKKYKSLGLDRGEFAKVIGHSQGNIIIERSNGTQVNWRPALSTGLSAFTEESRELAIGDNIRFTANNHAQGYINGDQAEVINVDHEKQQVMVRMADGSNLTLNASAPLTVDYGYCSTVHSAQGQTCDRVLIDADTHSLTANQSTFYVAISRARHEAKIYTDDREMLPGAMSREFEKTSALELNQNDNPLAINSYSL